MTPIVKHYGLMVLLAALAGCQTQRAPQGQPVTQALEKPRPVDVDPAHQPAARRSWQADSSSQAFPSSPEPQTTEEQTPFEPLALINGTPIDRNRIARLVIESYGLTVFEQVLTLELAKQKAATKNLQVTQEDVDAEYERSLRQISLPPGGTSDEPLSKDASEALLRQLLISKNIPRPQFMLGVERNAYLRKLAEKDLVIEEPQLRSAYDRLYGERAEIRLIQVDSLGEAARIRERIEKGEDFAELAKKHSREVISAPIGGLLRPFTREDREFPPLFITTAFALEPGQVSKAIPWQGKYNLIKLERRYPKTKISFEDVKAKLAERVREEQLLERMKIINHTLLKEASIRILDPELDRRFRERFKDMVRG